MPIDMGIFYDIYKSTEQGQEAKFKARLEQIKKWKNEHDFKGEI